MTLFDHLNNITNGKKYLDMRIDENSKTYANYMINRFVSMSEIYLPLVNEMNKFDVSKSTHQRFYTSTLPKRKQFFSYIKKKKDVNESDLKYLMHFFECGLKEAKMYLEVMDDKTIAEILKKYTYGKNKKADI